MRIRVAIFALLAFLLISLQTAVSEYIRIMGIKPNLVLVFIICAALLNGNVEGAVTGAVMGLALDMISGRLLGFHALLGMYTGVAVGTVNKRIFKDNLLVIMAITFITTLVYEFLVFFLSTLFDRESAVMMVNPFTGVILPEALYNCVVSMLLYKLMYVIDKRTAGIFGEKRR